MARSLGVAEWTEPMRPVAGNPMAPALAAATKVCWAVRSAIALKFRQ